MKPSNIDSDVFSVEIAHRGLSTQSTFSCGTTFWLVRTLLMLIAINTLNNIYPQIKNNYTLIEVYGFIVDADSMGGVSYASVIEEGTRNGTTADVHGFFRIYVRPPTKIRVSRLGYKSKTLQIESNQGKPLLYMKIQMERDTIEVGEVIILPWKSYEEFLFSVCRADSFIKYLLEWSAFRNPYMYAEILNSYHAGEAGFNEAQKNKATAPGFKLFKLRLGGK